MLSPLSESSPSSPPGNPPGGTGGGSSSRGVGGVSVSTTTSCGPSASSRLVRANTGSGARGDSDPASTSGARTYAENDAMLSSSEKLTRAFRADGSCRSADFAGDTDRGGGVCFGAVSVLLAAATLAFRETSKVSSSSGSESCSVASSAMLSSSLAVLAALSGAGMGRPTSESDALRRRVAAPRIVVGNDRALVHRRGTRTMSSSSSLLLLLMGAAGRTGVLRNRREERDRRGTSEALE